MTQVMVASAISDTSADDRAGIRGSRPRAGYRGDGHRSPAGRGTGRTRRAVTRGHARPRAGFHKASWRTVSWVRVTGWHANDRTRVLPRFNGQPEPGPYSRGHPVISRARRVSHAAPVNEGLVRNSAIGGADAAHPRNIRTAVEASAPPARLAPGRLRRLGTAAGHHPPAAAAQRRRRRLPGQACGPRSAAAGTGVKAARPPRPPPMPPAGPRRKCSASRPAQPHSCLA
jgi:hypothetical protein